MKNIIQVLVLLMVAQSATARSLPPITVDVPEGVKSGYHRGIIETHNAIESESLRITMDSNHNGFIEGKVCDFCETIRVNITAQTKAYNNNVEVPLINAKARLGRFATVIYEVKSKNVSAIRW